MIVLPFPPSSLSGHAKGNSHWGKSSVTKKWREDAASAATGVRFAPFPDAKPYAPGGDIHIHITFVPGDRRGDRVNFPNRCKPIFDGIADALGVNDSRFVPHYYFREPQKPGHIEIRIGQ